jgi:hypothetical protein
MWSGSASTIPAGYVLCNGTNGTPDLRDRFIIGATGSFGPGAVGGSPTIGINNLPGHNHSLAGAQIVLSGGTTGGGGAHSHTINDPGHVHSNGRTPLGSTSGSNPNLSSVASNTGAAATGISINGVGDHVHSISGPATINSGSTGSTGGGAPYYPSYYALCYIMKT